MIRPASQVAFFFMVPQIDLHSHSTVSDGTLTPSELVHHAHARGVQVLALTDHDDVAGLPEATDTAHELGMSLIPGVEISVTWNRRTLHIVGLRVSAVHEPLQTGLAKIRESRHTRAQGMADSLSRFGIANSLQGAYDFAPQGIISRTHFARFLVAQGYAKDTRSVFKRFLVKGKPGYFEHRWADLADAVSWIVHSGGIAVLAHPGRYDLGRTNLLTLLYEFREMGGRGIEVVSGSHTVEQYQEFARLAHQFDLLASSGSDYHGPGQSYLEMGRLPALPHGCVPVWHDWEEMH
jgi:predicted metal-dependent phosphoesterase TrpH